MYHSVFLSDGGRVFSCGHGQGGRLGQDSEKPSLVPQAMKVAPTEVCAEVAVGLDHTLLLMENGNVRKRPEIGRFEFWKIEFKN